MKVLWVAPLVLVVVAACGRKAPATTGGAAVDTGTTGRPAVALGAAAQLDSGNAAFRAKDYTGALAHYRGAAERQPQLAAAWFGVYMAQSALGNKTAADSAMRRAQALDPGMVGGHPTSPAPEGALPPGHPATGAAPLPAGHPAAPSR